MFKRAGITEWRDRAVFLTGDCVAFNIIVSPVTHCCNIKEPYILVTVKFISVFKRAGIEEWRDKTVFLCCDGAAVNLGRRNGVAVKLKDDVGHLVAVHCVAHRLELGITKSIKDDAKLKRLNEVLSFLYEQNSSPRKP